MLQALSLLALVVLQDPATDDSRVERLTLTSADPVLVEGKGPTVVVEYVCEFAGTLHVWARSEVDVDLQVDDARDFRTLARDESSGGGTTPYVTLPASPGDVVAVLVSAAAPEHVGPVELRFVAAPETEATREVAALADEGLREAELLLASGEFDGARAIVVELLAALLEVPGGGGSQAVAYQLRVLGLYARTLGLLDVCAEAWSACLAHSRAVRPPDHAELRDDRSNLAVTLGERGDLATACELLQGVVASAERAVPPGHPDRYGAQLNLAGMLASKGDLREAREFFERALQGVERAPAPDVDTLLSIKRGLAATLAELGDDLDEARSLLEEVVEIRESRLADDDLALVGARQNLAATLMLIGDYQAARVLFEGIRDWAVRTLPRDHPYAILSGQGLASAMNSMGDRRGALALFSTVLEASERTLPPDHPDLMQARVNVASALNHLGSHAEARARYEEVIAAGPGVLPEDHPKWVAVPNGLALALYHLGELAEARALEEDLLERRERTLPENHPDVLRSRARLAVTMRAMGESEEALALERQVYEAERAAGTADRSRLVVARHNLAFALDANGDGEGARALVPEQVEEVAANALAALAFAPRSAAESVRSSSLWLSGLLHWTRASGDELQSSVFELQETLRLVSLEAARALRGSREPGVQVALREAEGVRTRLHELMSDPAGEAEDVALELNRLTLERDRLEDEASRLLAGSGVVMQPVELEALARALGEGGAAVAYRRIGSWSRASSSSRAGDRWQSTDHLSAHVLRPDGSLSRLDLGPAAELERLVEEWRPALGLDATRGIALSGRSERNSASTGVALRERLLDPVLAQLDETTRRLFVCADDLVFLVPLDALPFEGGVVGDRWSLVNEVSFARLLSSDSRATSEPGLFALGGVDYGRRPGDPGEFAFLAETAAEAEAVAELFAEVFGESRGLPRPEAAKITLSGRAASKRAVYREAPGKRYLHLATHGWFAPETTVSALDAPSGDGPSRTLVPDVQGLAPMLLCGLALAGANEGRDSLGRVGGILTAEELCGLDLSDCELAVLSACETNVGVRRAGQGVQSLQAALYAAGVESSITSLWRVDDTATRRLMELFYTNLWRVGMPKAEALWSAKVTMREEGHPLRHWAGWILTGNPD